MNIGTGVWTAQETGLYQVTWSLMNQLDDGEFNHIYLFKNGVRNEESTSDSWYKTYSGEKTINDNIGKTLMLELRKGDTLKLKTTEFKGQAWFVHFCVSLVKVP